jgi:predicted RNA binding protein YcfA (HicA-like mRNA interferase family)
VRLPRDLSGHDLARALGAFGYVVTRQVGSHLRLTTSLGGEHHITISAHPQLRVGTLAAILGEVARHRGLERSAVVQRLFG